MMKPIFPRALPSLALLSVVLCSSPEAATQAGSSRFPTPSAGMTIERRAGEAPITVEELLLEFGELTGEHLIWTDDTGAVLKEVRVAFDRTFAIPAEELYSAVEAILIANRFVLTDLRREEPRMMAVHSLDSPARAHLRAGATHIDTEDLPLYADHPAILIRTVVHLPRIDVRRLSNAMRGMVADPNTMQVIPVPESNGLILTGFGADLVELVLMLRELNESSSGLVKDPEPWFPPVSEPTPPLPSTPKPLVEPSDHQKVGELIGNCLEAYVARAGRRETEAELRKTLEKKWNKKAESGDALALTEDLEVALYYMRDYSRARGVKKGKVAEFEIPVPFYGEGFTSTYALWAPAKYSAGQGPYPLILCIPDAGEEPREHLTEQWADTELRKTCILVALRMPKKLENWSGLGVSRDPENPGGYGLLLTALADVRDRYAIDFDKVFIAGRGIGVAAAMEIASSTPDRFAGVIGRGGDAAEISPDNLSNLHCLFVGGGAKAAAFAERARELDYVEPTVLPEAGEAYLLAWIMGRSRRSHPESVVLRAGAPMPNNAYWLEIPAHDGQSLARLTARADREANTITVDAEGINSVTLFFNDILVDLDEPVRVICNGVEHEHQIPRNFNAMMQQIYRGRSDPGKVYTAVKRYDLPE